MKLSLFASTATALRVRADLRRAGADEIVTEEGPFSLPNAGVLAAATGPRSAEETSTTGPKVEVASPTFGVTGQ